MYEIRFQYETRKNRHLHRRFRRVTAEELPRTDGFCGISGEKKSSPTRVAYGVSFSAYSDGNCVARYDIRVRILYYMLVLSDGYFCRHRFTNVLFSF